MFSNGRSVLFLNRINKPEDTIKKIDNINEEKIKKAMDNTFKKGIINSAYVGEQIDLNLVKILMEKHTVPFNNSKTTLI